MKLGGMAGTRLQQMTSSAERYNATGGEMDSEVADAALVVDIIHAFGGGDEHVNAVDLQPLGPPPAHIRAYGIEQLHPPPITGKPAVPPECLLSVPNSGLITVAEMLAVPPPRYIVKDLVPQRGLLGIYGAPGAAKTFLAIDLAFAIEAGRSHWFGLRLMQAPVAFVVLEGKGNFQRRVKAYLAHTGEQPGRNLRFYPHPFSLLDRADAEALGELIRRELGSGCVVFIDTLSRACAGGDENSAIDMTTAIANADLIGDIVEGPILVIHHSGKDAGKGMRGHSSLLGAVDGSIEVVNDKGLRSWSVKKNKDGGEGQVHPFELVAYNVGQDQWGEPMTSCAVRPIGGPQARRLAQVTGKHRIAVMASVRALLAQHGDGVDEDQLLTAAAPTLSVEERRRNSVAKSTVESLIASGHLRLANGKILLC